jgi:hypothetical protein
VFTAPLHSNGRHSSAGCVFVAAGMYLPSRCLAMDISSHHLYYHRYNSIFWTTAFLRRFGPTCLLHHKFLVDRRGFPFFGFRKNHFLQTKVVSFAANPSTWKTSLYTYVPQWKGDPIIPPGTAFPFLRLLRLAGLQWRYSNQPPHWTLRLLVTSKTN